MTRFPTNKKEEYPLQSVICFISKAFNKLDQWILKNIREIIIKNSLRYVTADPNAHIYLLLLYMFLHLIHVKIA